MMGRLGITDEGKIGQFLKQINYNYIITFGDNIIMNSTQIERYINLVSSDLLNISDPSWIVDFVDS